MALYGIKTKPSKASQPSLIHEINPLFVTSVNNEFLIEYTPLCFKQYNVDLATEPVKLGVSLFKRTLEFRLEEGGGGGLPRNRLMGMCRWMRLHFYDWIDYNGRFNRVTRMGSHIFDLDFGDK